MTTKSKYLTVDDIIDLGKVEKHIYGEVKKTILNFETVTVSIAGSDHDIIYGNFVENIFTGAPSPKTRVVERLTTS